MYIKYSANLTWRGCVNECLTLDENTKVIKKYRIIFCFINPHPNIFFSLLFRHSGREEEKKKSIWERHIRLVASRMCLCGLWPFGVPPSQSNTESLNPINQWLLVLTVAQNHLKNTESQAPLTVLKGSLGWGLSIGYFFFPRDPQVSSICCKHWEPQPWVFCFFPLASIYLPLTPRFFTVEIIDPFYFPSFRLKIS